MADMTQLMGEMLGKNIQDNITTLMKLLNQNVDSNVYHHGILRALKSAEAYDSGGPLTLDRIQVTADNTVKILAPRPVKDKKADKNGKGATQELDTDVVSRP
jgi:hypothetical protein